MNDHNAEIRRDKVSSISSKKSSTEKSDNTEEPKEYNQVVLFYKYAVIEEPLSAKEWFENLTSELNLLGRILIAPEGLNGTLAGTKKNVENFCTAAESYPNIDAIDWKYSGTSKAPNELFPDMYIKVCKEIV